MEREYSREEIAKVIEKLPSELKEALFSSENAEHLKNISERYNIERMKLAQKVGYILMGLLLPDDFREWLETEFGGEKAKRISHDINRFILFPVKHSLAELYKMEVIPTVPKPKAPPKKEDIYREPLE